uniref:Secreted protein n=1 Tax=Rhodopseudomonas palustris (strain BisA53) TaxID=316055 RepID=Q07HH8_RHOP5
MKLRFSLATLLLLISIDSAFAVDPRYPDWPCAQAKVPDISLGAVWAGPPLDDAAKQWKDDAAVSALVSRLAARRTPLDEAEKRAGEFVAAAGAGANKSVAATRLFAGLFDSINAQRSSVLNGLERITRKQRAAAQKIRDDTVALQALQGAQPTDTAKIEELSNQLVWQTRIFEDRRQVIKFVCEVPVALDQRLFALGRVIQQEME